MLPPPRTEPDAPDEFRWLEETQGTAALDWVEAHNALTERTLFDAAFQATETRILEVLDSADRIPMVSKRGPDYYNFWRDAEHPRGLWRRTSWEDYCSAEPTWEVLLDVGALGRAEGVDWVWGGALFLRPAPDAPYERALIALSPDGGDAHRYREYDVVRQEFVLDGFDLPAAKSRVSWVDADTVHVATDFGPGSMTSSSYPRTVRTLRRGQEPDAAPVIFEVPPEHMMATVAHDQTPGYERDIAVDTIDFHSSRTFLRRDGEWARVDVPEHVYVSPHRQWLVLRPRTDWDVGGRTHPGGSLLIADLDMFMAGDRRFHTAFTPSPTSSLQSWSWTRDYLLVNVLQDVSSQILLLTPGESWAVRPLDACPPLHTVEAFAVDDEDDDAGNDYWLVSTGFLTPSTLSRGTIGGGHQRVRGSASFFDAGDFSVKQHFATSADGTQVPYFQVSRDDLPLDGANPTLLNGYGGFEHSLTPAYSPAVGRGWLERKTPEGRNGVYVLANIRGGGEYGPQWHHAALRENRHRAYEDFAAIAQDLIDRKVTSPALLGCTGRSNGGLLVGNMLTSYPGLFGAISCGVPLLDMQRYTQLGAGHSWIAEYGDPDNPEDWDFLRTFSPYHLLEPGIAYPPALIWTATSDDRVSPAHARKMVARMLCLGVENVSFHEALDGGHAGASDNSQAARMHAMSYEFLWRALVGKPQQSYS